LLVSAGEPITKRGDVLLSSSFCQVREKAEAIKNICRNLFECYGTAEVAIATIIQHDEESLNTVGKEITGVSVETKLASTPSEIMVKSSFIADRIYDTKDGKILKHPIGNWFETGDLGILIDGNLVFLGRLNDRISVGGMKVFPAEVEKVLMEMPNIKECLVFSVPNVNLEETIGVGVVFAKEAMNISQIQNYCLDKLEPYKIPQLVLMLDSIPLSNGGKPDRQQLTKLAIKNVKFKKET
jgi:acyl-CoA synthetase (AMP-forming)/AMP-acid ligase II